MIKQSLANNDSILEKSLRYLEQVLCWEMFVIEKKR